MLAISYIRADSYFVPAFYDSVVRLEDIYVILCTRADSVVRLEDIYCMFNTLCTRR